MLRRADRDKRSIAPSWWLHGILLMAVVTLLLYSLMALRDTSPLQALSRGRYNALNEEQQKVTGENQRVQESSIRRDPNPTKRSKYAYSTLISGFDEKFKYRGFIYNALIMKKALKEQGSQADFIVMVAFQNNHTEPYESDMNLLRRNGIIVHYLTRILDSSTPLHFAEMALLKVTPWSFTEYDRVQFLDGDVMPTANMDCFFYLNMNAFTIGAVSPLNSGWYLALPNEEDYGYMIRKVIELLHFCSSYIVYE